MKLIFQSKVQRTEQLTVGIFSFFIDSFSKIVCFPLVFCHRHIFQNGHGRTGPHGRILKNASDLVHAPVFRHVGDICSIDQNSAFINRNTSADNVQHGGLSGTIAADYRNKFPIFYFKIKIIEQAHFIDCARIIIFINLSEFKHRLSP